MMIMECPETTTAPIQMILDCEAYNQQKENFALEDNMQYKNDGRLDLQFASHL